jgi:hypothetical protein
VELAHGEALIEQESTKPLGPEVLIKLSANVSIFFSEVCYIFQKCGREGEEGRVMVEVDAICTAEKL